MSRYLLVRVNIHAESSLDLFDSGSVPNVMSWRMADRLNLRTMPTKRGIKVDNCSSERCVESLENVPVKMGELVVPLDLLILDGSPYDVIVGLTTMIHPRARPDYYQMLISIHFNCHSEMLNYDYEHENGHTWEDEFTTTRSNDTVDEGSEDELVLMLRHEDLGYGDNDEDELLNESCHISTRAGGRGDNDYPQVS